ncbi:MAG: hypothetical protein LBI37_03575, partial [Puniceicoccales bacterium]|nr:hypothetical protein [Puniceicoccales bacterium]
KHYQKKLKSFTPEELEELKRKQNAAAKNYQQKKLENLTLEGLEELKRKQNEIAKKFRQKPEKPRPKFYLPSIYNLIIDNQIYP